MAFGIAVPAAALTRGTSSGRTPTIIVIVETAAGTPTAPVVIVVGAAPRGRVAAALLPATLGGPGMALGIAVPAAAFTRTTAGRAATVVVVVVLVTATRPRNSIVLIIAIIGAPAFPSPAGGLGMPLIVAGPATAAVVVIVAARGRTSAIPAGIAPVVVVIVAARGRTPAIATGIAPVIVFIIAREAASVVAIADIGLPVH